MSVLLALVLCGPIPYVSHPPEYGVVEVGRDPAVEPDTPDAPPMQEPSARLWLSRVNRERHRAGYRDAAGRRSPSPPLRFNPILQRAAEWKVRQMNRTVTLSHQDPGVWTQMVPIPPIPGYAAPTYERTAAQRAWAFGFRGQVSEGLGALGDTEPACIGVDDGFPGGYDAAGHRLVNHHEDGMQPGWTEFGFAAGGGFSCTLYGRTDRWTSTPWEDAEEHRPTTFYGSEEQAGRTPPPPLP